MSVLDDEYELASNCEDIIWDFLKENYHIERNKTKIRFDQSKGTYIIDYKGYITVKNYDMEHLTNNLFRWGEVSLHFCCDVSSKLKTLEGAPQKCGMFFCRECDSLESLEGAPKECSHMHCDYCLGLESLKGAPEECNFFSCKGCNKLENLEGAPQKCDNFTCSFCKNLKTLEGAPKECSNFVHEFCYSLQDLKGAPKKCDEINPYGCTNLIMDLVK